MSEKCNTVNSLLADAPNSGLARYSGHGSMYRLYSVLRLTQRRFPTEKSSLISGYAYIIKIVAVTASHIELIASSKILWRLDSPKSIVNSESFLGMNPLS